MTSFLGAGHMVALAAGTSSVRPEGPGPSSTQFAQVAECLPRAVRLLTWGSLRRPTQSGSRWRPGASTTSRGAGPRM